MAHSRIAARGSVTHRDSGGRDDRFRIHGPVADLYTIAKPRTDWCCRKHR